MHVLVSFDSSLRAFKTPCLVRFIHLKILVNVVRTFIWRGLLFSFLWGRLMRYFFLLLLNIARVSFLFLLMFRLGLSFLLFFNLRIWDPIIHFMNFRNLFIIISQRQNVASPAFILLRWLLWLIFWKFVNKATRGIIKHKPISIDRVDSVWYKHAWLFFFFNYVLKVGNLHPAEIIYFYCPLTLSLFRFLWFITELIRYPKLANTLAFVRSYTFNN